MKTSFIYHGPTSGVTLRNADGTQDEVMLHNGAVINVDAAHSYVQKLVAQKRLEQIERQPLRVVDTGSRRARPRRETAAAEPTPTDPVSSGAGANEEEHS